MHTRDTPCDGFSAVVSDEFLDSRQMNEDEDCPMTGAGNYLSLSLRSRNLRINISGGSPASMQKW
jgi:hypothetical protein